MLDLATGGVTRLRVVTTLRDAPARPRRVPRAAALPVPALLVIGLVVGLGGPAAAAVPQGWSDPEPVSALSFLLVVVVAPVVLALVIALLTYLPSMLRGQGLAPGSAGGEDEWFGGPIRGTAELAAADDEGSKAGGAGARW